jgi:hypothetical protein
MNKMGETTLFLGLRKSNGQIGYLSEGIKIPEFFELIQPKENNISVLIDFSPVIEKLHSLHNNHYEEEIKIQYNSLYNYWQDAKTFSDTKIILSRSESLSSSANELLNKLHIMLDKKKSQFWSANGNRNKLVVVRSIKSDCDIYIDTLLCFIHSKASLEVSSFKRDHILKNYCDFIKGIVSEIYFQVISYNNKSLFHYLAFEKNTELQSYLDLEPSQESAEDFMLNIIKKTNPEEYNDGYSSMRQVIIRYEYCDNDKLMMAKILRDLMYKINSISRLLIMLKEDNIEWVSNTEITKEITVFLEELNIK